MQKLIDHLRKKLKKTKSSNKKLKSKIKRCHYDITVLDYTNGILEQENENLKKRLEEYETIYLKDAKSEYDKRLHEIMAKVNASELKGFKLYKNAIAYMYEYIKVLERIKKKGKA